MASQNEIATDIQKGIKKANSRSDKTSESASTAEGKATQFDGNPTPTADKPEGILKPKDDTPWVTPKRDQREHK